MARMSTRRLEKISRLKKDEAKKQSIGAELLLNRAVSIAAPEIKRPVIWETDENGKLYIPDSNIYVNLSHSGKYAVCAVSDKPIGIDIQLCDKADMEIAKRFFAPDEVEYLENGGDFFEIWVKKESFIKAVGMGLGMSLKSFSVMDNTTARNTPLQCTPRPMKITDYAHAECYKCLYRPESSS